MPHSRRFRRRSPLTMSQSDIVRQNVSRGSLTDRSTIFPSTFAETLRSWPEAIEMDFRFQRLERCGLSCPRGQTWMIRHRRSCRERQWSHRSECDQSDNGHCVLSCPFTVKHLGDATVHHTPSVACAFVSSASSSAGDPLVNAEVKSLARGPSVSTHCVVRRH